MTKIRTPEEVLEECLSLVRSGGRKSILVVMEVDDDVHTKLAADGDTVPIDLTYAISTLHKSLTDRLITEVISHRTGGVS